MNPNIPTNTDDAEWAAENLQRIAPFAPDDFDWALGELFHLAKQAGRAKIFPPLYNPELFHACWYFVTAQPHVARQQILYDFTRIYMDSRMGYFREYLIAP